MENLIVHNTNSGKPILATMLHNIKEDFFSLIEFHYEVPKDYEDDPDEEMREYYAYCKENRLITESQEFYDEKIFIGSSERFIVTAEIKANEISDDKYECEFYFRSKKLDYDNGLFYESIF